jgi:hypothetical protein|nr:MAG TPA: hypothetical protein [Caudoviricetes sp.]
MFPRNYKKGLFLRLFTFNDYDLKNPDRLSEQAKQKRPVRTSFQNVLIGFNLLKRFYCALYGVLRRFYIKT